MNKTAIKNFAISARKKLIAMAIDKAGIIGITKDGASKASSFGKDFAIFPTHFGTETQIDGRYDLEQREKLVNKIKQDGFDVVIEEVAYTWFNRIIAMRFMEVNNYLPSGVRVLSSETTGKFEPDIVTQAPEIGLDFTDAQKDEIYTLKDDPRKSGELFKKLFIKECNELSKILPQLFESTLENNDFTEILFDLSWDKDDGVVRELLAIDEADFLEAVEIIGWMYQYYNEDRKNEVINIYKGIVKTEDIPAATQLFTTDWVVRYMVDNSLGRYWIERNPNSKLKDKLAFFIASKSGEIQMVNEKIDPTELTFFDPCMGSGHILVYAFDVLMEIYRECGYSDIDAVDSIVQHNLYGLDIDNRAYQLAYFAVMMRARHFDHRALSRGFSPNVFTPKGYHDGFKYGSLLLVDKLEPKPEPPEELTLFNMDYEERLDEWNFRRLLSQKYCIICTNPPYLNKMNDVLKGYVNEHYKDYSCDLFSVFIYRNFSFCKPNGYSAFMSPFVWMFIKTYEKLRNFIISTKSITTLIQMEYSAFEEATVPICSFVLKNGKSSAKGLYLKLSDFKGGMEVQKQKVFEAIADKNCDYFYETPEENFKKIPGSPIAYWVSENMLSAFKSTNTISKIAPPKQGLATANNDEFLRLWFETLIDKIKFNITSCDEALKSNGKWFPYNKGGAFRRWYGNREYIVNWENDGSEIKNFKDKNGKVRSRPQNIQYYFRPSITWSDITSAVFSGRYCENGFMFDVKGSSGFPNENDILYVLGFLNSTISQKCIKILNPTITTQVGDMARIPVIFSKEHKPQIDTFVKQNISLSKTDWDSFETSWDFKKHPLIRESTVQMAFAAWEQECNHRFNTLKANEEELNRIFIEIYGLQDELTPEVADKDVTVRKADLTRDIKSLISYAVGCMFGRYSLDVEGIAFAGGEFDSSKYSIFIPDCDNILPITDEEYFEDDIVSSFVEFVRLVYGDNTLEENLEFIAEALGNKGGSPRQVIRNYFRKDFYKDHCKIYQKRPIYWLFDSGKADSFKALIYLHRYDCDTVGRVRTDYLHTQQGFLENAIEYCDYILNSSQNPRDKADATKRKNKLVKQLAETKLYDQAMGHIALQRIDLDLDDGVKVNYQKFQGVEVAREGQKTLSIDLLGKI